MSRIFIRRGAALFRLFTALFIAIAMSAAPAAADAPKGPVSSSTVSINGQAFQLKSGVAFYRADWPGAPVVINLLFTDNTSLVFSVPNRSGQFDGSAPITAGGMTANYYGKGVNQYGISTGSCGSPGFILNLDKNGSNYSARFAGRLLKAPCGDRGKMETIQVNGDLAFTIND